MMATELPEVRCGGRNYLRPGDPCRITPSKPGRRDGGPATVRRILDTGAGVEVEVAFGNPDAYVDGRRVPRPVRTFRLDRVQRVAITRSQPR